MKPFRFLKLSLVFLPVYLSLAGQRSFCAPIPETTTTATIAFTLQTPPSSERSFIIETARHLSWLTSRKNFRIVYVPSQDIGHIIEAGQVDFFVCDASQLAQFTRSGARTLATLVSDRHPDPDHATAAALVVRTQSDFHALPDLRHKRLAAEGHNTIAGILALEGEIARLNEDPDQFFSFVKFFGDTGGRKALDAVVRGEFDAAVVRAGLLEDLLEASGRSYAGILRVLPAPPINENNVIQDAFSDARSTQTYPGLIFGSTRTASRELIREVLGALLNKPANAWGERWSVSPNLEAADRLLKLLRTGPYAYERHWTIERVWREYRWLVLLLAGLLIMVLLHGWLMEILVRRRTAELALQNHQIEALERSGIVGQLSTIVAHDLKHPLAAILNLVRGLSRSIEDRIACGSLPLEEGIQIEEKLEEIGDEARRAVEAIDHVRAHARVPRGEMKKLNLSEVLQKTVQDFVRIRTWSHPVVVTGPEHLEILGRQLEIELLILNILKNAAEACVGVRNPTISASLECLPTSEIRLAISDNGPPITDERLEELQHFAAPSDKRGGLGLGMGIIRTLAEAHLAHVQIERNPTETGLCICVIFPSAGQKITAPEGRNV